MIKEMCRQGRNGEGTEDGDRARRHDVVARGARRSERAKAIECRNLLSHTTGTARQKAGDRDVREAG